MLMRTISTLFSDLHHLRQFSLEGRRHEDRRESISERRLCGGHKIINLKTILAEKNKKKGMVCLAEEINTKSLDAIRRLQPLYLLHVVGSFRQEGTWDGNNEKTIRHVCGRQFVLFTIRIISIVTFGIFFFSLNSPLHRMSSCYSVLLLITTIDQ